MFGIFKLGSMLARGVWDSCKTPEERVNARMDAAVAKAGIPMSKVDTTPSGNVPPTDQSAVSTNSRLATDKFTIGNKSM